MFVLFLIFLWFREVTDLDDNQEATTPITLRLLIDQDTYERVKGASFKSPYYIPTHFDKLGSKLVQSITIWLNAKAIILGERRVPGMHELFVIM